MKQEKPKKKPSKYEKKLKVNASFDEILTLMVTTPPPKGKRNVEKKDKKKQ